MAAAAFGTDAKQKLRPGGTQTAAWPPAAAAALALPVLQLLLVRKQWLCGR